MLAIVHLLGPYVANLFKSGRRLEAENSFFVISSTSLCDDDRHVSGDRALLVWMTQVWLLGLVRVAARSVEALWTAIGQLLAHFDAEECVNYLRDSGYVRSA